jgi:hypothetical protein
MVSIGLDRNGACEDARRSGGTAHTSDRWILDRGRLPATSVDCLPLLSGKETDAGGIGQLLP